jgi:hypothetical protein
MSNHPFHLSDAKLLLAAEGELASRPEHGVRDHLAVCASCRARLAQLEKVAADFAETYREGSDPRIPPAIGPRAHLRMRLSEMAQPSRSASWTRLALLTPRIGWAAMAAAFLLCLAAGMFAFHSASTRQLLRQTTAFDPGFVPNRELTPGAARPVSMDEVCSMPHEEVVKQVSSTLRAQVFEEYGIADTSAGNYEIDYLIAPGLGGTADIHNLWPEPYQAGAWDAHAKDALEERLHQLVCAHKLDLLTAQRAIATNWIAAYKKYFDTDKPQFVAEVPGAPLAPIRRKAHGAGQSRALAAQPLVSGSSGLVAPALAILAAI